MEEPGFWDNADKANNSMKELKNLKDTVEEYHRLETAWEDVETLLEMGYEENDASLIPEVQEAMVDFEKRFEHLRIKTLLSEEYDGDNAIVTLHAGAGGTEACDWVGMLFRMYTRWAEKHGFATTVLDYLDGEEAGIKSVTVEIAGENAYGYMKSEKGIHRLVRKSPFDANARRHTSFTSVYVYPEVDDSIDIEINPADLSIDVFRASGAGGQHIQKTESAVRIHHKPTGIITICQDDRSQHRNREKAMQQLKAKLYELEMRKRMEAQTKLEESKSDIGWGHQIRSYVLDQSRVKDLRTGVETGNTGGVLDGDLDQFIEASLKGGVNAVPAAE